jgi:hypothetical protein
LRHRARATSPRARRADRKQYPCQHFEIYLGALFEQTVADQTAFLAEHLAAKPAPAT